MSDDDYMRGFTGQARVPTNYDELRGNQAFEHNERARQQLERSHTGSPFESSPSPFRIGPFDASPAAAGSGIGGLVLFVAAIWVIWQLLPFIPSLALNVFVWVAAALIGGVVLLGITGVVYRNARVGYALARQCAFAGLWRFIALTVIMRILAGWYQAGTTPAGDLVAVLPRVWQSMLVSARSFSYAADAALFAAAPLDRWPTVLGTLLVIRGPGLLAFAAVLSRRLAPYRSVVGFFVAIVVALITAEVSLPLAVSGCVWLWHHAQIVPFTGDERLSILVVYSAVLVTPCAFIGALPGGALVFWLTRVFARERVGSYRRSYAAASRALLAYGFLTVLAVFLFRDADAILWWLVHRVFGPTAHDAAVTPAALGALIIFQVPGLLAAGRAVARKEPLVFDGVTGYAKACVVAALTCAAICLPVWAVALYELPPVVAWLKTMR